MVKCNLNYGSNIIKCRNKFHCEIQIFFCLKWPKSSLENQKKKLHFKMLTLQNVKFEISEQSNMTIIVFSHI